MYIYICNNAAKYILILVSYIKIITPTLHTFIYFHILQLGYHNQSITISLEFDWSLVSFTKLAATPLASGSSIFEWKDIK